MTDYHVHIGQFDKAYYFADRVFFALKASGVDEVYFSSTTSCLYCSPKDLYEGVRGEVRDALSAAEEISIKAHALYWVVPDVHFSIISIKQAMCEIAYDGFKIHPRAQKWDLSDERIHALAEEVFLYAEKHDKMILIHCDEDYPPTLFEPFIKAHPDSLVQMAHCRPLFDTLEMLKTYPNTVCDSAMASKENIERIQNEGFADRIRYGTDFPITHYRAIHPKTDPTQEELKAFLLR
ncbi:MAG: amidohydrolase family protein [Spirochaetaceae bacterium]|nr:amidohydrolase family protein [Spirochaetaceae bacterium]